MVKKERKTWTTLYYNKVKYSRYKVSTRGEIKDMQTNKMVKTYLTKGYKKANVLDDYLDNTNIAIHKAVYESFTGIDSNKDYLVHHVNKDKLDNRLCNLVMVSKGDHQKLHSMDNIRSRVAKPVVVIDLETLEEMEFESANKAVLTLCGKVCNTWDICSGDRFSFYNRKYTIRYANWEDVPKKWIDRYNKFLEKKKLKKH